MPSAQDHAPFRQVEIERATLLARDGQRFVRRPDIGQRFADSRVYVRVRLAIKSGLGPGISQPGCRPHDAAQECVALLMTVTVEHHACHKTGAVNTFLSEQRSADNSSGKHRHDAVGEIGAVAALQGFLVERRAGCDVCRGRHLRWRPARCGHPDYVRHHRHPPISHHHGRGPSGGSMVTNGMARRSVRPLRCDRLRGFRLLDHREREIRSGCRDREWRSS